MMPLAFGQANIDGSYWSLRFELAFYLLIAVCWFVLRCRRLDWFCLISIGVVGLMRTHTPGQFSPTFQLITCKPWANFLSLVLWLLSYPAAESASLPS